MYNAFLEVISFLKFLFSTPDFIFIFPVLGILISPFAYVFFNKEEVKFFFFGVFNCNSFAKYVSSLPTYDRK